MNEPEPSDLDIAPPSRSFWRNLSFVWLVPVLALALSLGLAWRTYADRGELIEIRFVSASGIVPGETTLRFRDVTIGTVESVGFTRDLAKVRVMARVNQDVADYLDAQAAFWIVSPKVSTRGVTGLATVLTGVYIEGAWDNEPGEAVRVFEGSDGPPLEQPGRAGTRITLMSEDGRLLSEGAPVFFKGVEVGKLEKPRLVVSSDIVVVDAFIQAPHDRRLNSATRFWDTSGFSVSINASGLSVDFESIASLFAGGVAFDSVFEGGGTVSAGHVYNVYAEEAEARRSLFVRASEASIEVAAEFGESVSGLEAGAEVRYHGLQVGEVTGITASIEETEFGPVLRPMARLALEPDRLGLPRRAGRDEVLDFLQGAVERGLRAQLATKSLFSGALVVDLVELAAPSPAVFQRDGDPLPVLPSEPSKLPDFTATAEGLLERINQLPVEELLQQATSMMASIEAVARQDGTLALPDAAVQLLEDARALVADDATRALPGEIRDAVGELRSALAGLGGDDGAVARLSAALEQADTVMANIATASEQFPGLVEELRAVAAKVNDLPAQELVESARKVLDSADEIIGSQAARDLPASIAAALDEVRAAVAGLGGDDGAVARLSAALENADTVIANLATASEQFPGLVEELRAVAAKVNDLPAQELVEAARKVLASADEIVGSEAARDLPATVNAALDEVRSAVSELRDGGALERLASALEQADKAIANIATASEEFPALMEDVRAVAEMARGLPAEELMASARKVLDSADQVLGTPSARELPESLKGALDEVRAAVSDLRDGGTVENVNATLASARKAADAVALATEELPDLARRLDRLATEAESLMAAYGGRSSFNDETLNALREVRNAARAVSQLARAIQRDPGILVRGR